MAHEVSFFHAMRMITFDKELHKKRKLYEMIQLSKAAWVDDVDARDVAAELEADIESLEASIAEAEADLHAAVEAGK